MGVPADGSYEIPEGIISGLPCTCVDGEYEIVQGLRLGDAIRERIDATVTELQEERDAVAGMGLV
jgi:malate dehydrogenase